RRILASIDGPAVAARVSTVVAGVSAVAVRVVGVIRVVARPNARADLGVVVAPAIAVVVDAGRIVRIAVRIAGIVATTIAAFIAIVALIVHVPLVSSGVVAPDDSRVGRLIANRRSAVRRCRLVARRNSIDPDAAHTGRGSVTRR